MFAESLTVRILADSSNFRGELDNALSQLDRFRESVRSLAGAGSALAESFSRLSQAVGPLQQISKLLSGIQQQIRAIGQTPLTIDVSQAIASLMSLLGMIEMVAARLRGLSMAGSLPGVSGPGGIPGGAPPGVAPGNGGVLPGLPGKYGAATALNATPLVAPTLLSAIVRPLAAEPRDVLMNQPSLVAAPSSVPVPTGRTAVATNEPTTTNHFGGITIQVRESADVNALVRDLRLQGIHLRNRRG